MKIAMVKRDGATVTPVQLGEGKDAERRLARLRAAHGAGNVTVEGGEPVAETPHTEKPSRPARARKPAKKSTKRRR